MIYSRTLYIMYDDLRVTERQTTATILHYKTAREI